MAKAQVLELPHSTGYAHHRLPAPTPDLLPIKRYLYFTGREGGLEVKAKCLWGEDVFPLLARGLNQHLGGVRGLLP